MVPLTDGLSKVHGESHEVPQTTPWVAPEMLCLLLAWLLFPLQHIHPATHRAQLNLFSPVLSNTMKGRRKTNEQVFTTHQ